MKETERKQTKKVLVIDDDALLVRLIEHNLCQAGIEVLKAYSGYEGISLIRTKQLDLVILDIVLPDISGWEVLERIRQISKVPILMLTIKEKENDIVRSLDSGADDYCTHYEAKNSTTDTVYPAERKGTNSSPEEERYHIGNDENQ